MHSCHGCILYDLLLITLRSMFLLYLMLIWLMNFATFLFFLQLNRCKFTVFQIHMFNNRWQHAEAVNRDYWNFIFRWVVYSCSFIRIINCTSLIETRMEISCGRAKKKREQLINHICRKTIFAPIFTN